MHISEILEKDRTVLSFEFFPPKTEDGAKILFENINELIPLNPGYVSVTYGAGGTTRELTHKLIMKIKNDTKLTVVAHLTCVGATHNEIRAIVQKYYENGIDNIMALRGDPPQGGQAFTAEPNGFGYAVELVHFIKKNFPSIGIGVAGYPEGHPGTPNRLKEMEYLKMKVDEGADYICTQLFFDNHDFYDFRERCIVAGIHVPIIAGIMPVTSFKTMNRMAELAGGTHYPAKFLKMLARAQSNEYVAKAGIHWCAEQVRDLLDNHVQGIHFYTFNKADRIISICDSLGIANSSQFNTQSR